MEAGLAQAAFDSDSSCFVHFVPFTMPAAIHSSRALHDQDQAEASHKSRQEVDVRQGSHGEGPACKDCREGISCCGSQESDLRPWLGHGAVAKRASGTLGGRSTTRFWRHSTLYTIHIIPLQRVAIPE